MIAEQRFASTTPFNKSCRMIPLDGCISLNTDLATGARVRIPTEFKWPSGTGGHGACEKRPELLKGPPWKCLKIQSENGVYGVF